MKSEDPDRKLIFLAKPLPDEDREAFKERVKLALREKGILKPTTPQNQVPKNSPDPHFGSDAEMLTWAKRKGITPTRNEFGEWDWLKAWNEYLDKTDDEEDALPPS